MFNFCSLYSGSSGNSFFVQSEKTNVLIDSGVSYKKIEEALTSIGSSINKINAILITHEHIDHVRGLNSLSSKYNIPIYANKKTWEALDSLNYKIPLECRNIFNNSENFEIQDLKILPFSIPHDSNDPCGFNIIKGQDKLSIATDLGHINSKLMKHFEGSSSIILESNYDPEILRFCSYPTFLKQRISSQNGHLPNNIASQTVCNLIPHGLKNALLVHLSKENNFPELAYQTALEELRKTNYTQDQILFNIAPRNKPSNLFNII